MCYLVTLKIAHHMPTRINLCVTKSYSYDVDEIKYSSSEKTNFLVNLVNC